MPSVATLRISNCAGSNSGRMATMGFDFTMIAKRSTYLGYYCNYLIIGEILSLGMSVLFIDSNFI